MRSPATVPRTQAARRDQERQEGGAPQVRRRALRSSLPETSAPHLNGTGECRRAAINLHARRPSQTTLTSGEKAQAKKKQALINKAKGAWARLADTSPAFRPALTTAAGGRVSPPARSQQTRRSLLTRRRRTTRAGRAVPRPAGACADRLRPVAPRARSSPDWARPPSLRIRRRPRFPLLCRALRYPCPLCPASPGRLQPEDLLSS